MVKYSAAPLASATVALIEPHTLKALLPADGVYVHRLFSALGFGRILDQTYTSIEGDNNKSAFFRHTLWDKDNFKVNAGLYIADDIIKTSESDSLIVKISVTDDSVVSTPDNANGGIVAFILPVDVKNNAVSITSGGLSAPAFLNGVGVSVLPTDYAFLNLAETLFTISSVLFEGANEAEGTGWSGGNNLSISLYRSDKGKVQRTYQAIIRSEDGVLVHKEANADATGYIAINEWQDITLVDESCASFVYHVHAKVADVLNEIENKTFSLSVVSGEDGEAAVTETPTESRFAPLVIDGLEEPDSVDAYPADEDLDSTEPLWDTPSEESHGEPEGGYEPEIVTGSITSVSSVHTPAELVEFAEYEVTHSEEPTTHGEVNDQSAETTEPFDLGAEFLINEFIEDEENPSEASKNVRAGHQRVADLEASRAEVRPLEDIVTPENGTFDDLQWSEVITGSTEIPVEASPVDDLNANFADLSWDEVALTVADDDSDAGDTKPLRGFLGN